MVKKTKKTSDREKKTKKAVNVSKARGAAKKTVTKGNSQSGGKKAVANQASGKEKAVRAVRKEAAKKTVKKKAVKKKTTTKTPATKAPVKTIGIKPTSVKADTMTRPQQVAGSEALKQFQIPKVAIKPAEKLVNITTLRGKSGHEQSVASLNPNLPLVLLPVRLETRFFGRELRIRIYPDQIHLNDHTKALTGEEEILGRRYWEEAWRSGTDEAAMLAAWKWLVDKVGARRAAWVARSLTPNNPELAPQQKLEEGEVLSVSPDFPDADISETDSPASVEAMPDRWVAVGVLNDEEVFAKWSQPVDQQLVMGFDMDTTYDDLTMAALKQDPGMAWMVDFNQAWQQGMGIKVNLTGKAAAVAEQGLDELIVLGVKTGNDPANTADRWRDLLEAHHYTQGLDLIPQGTPTNNTEQVESGWTGRETDLAAFRTKELDRAGEPPANSDGYLLAEAFGIRDKSLFHRLHHGANVDNEAQSAMNRLLWSETWARYFKDLIGQKRLNVNAARNWFIDHVRGGAHLPAIRVGNQPYGILPVRPIAAVKSPANDSEYVETIVDVLREDWRASLDKVPVMDPTLTRTGGKQDNDSESELIAILSSQPHPWQFSVRKLFDRKTENALGAWGALLLNLGSIIGTYDLMVAALRENPEYKDMALGYVLDRTFSSSVGDIETQIAYFEGLLGYIAQTSATSTQIKYARLLCFHIIKWLKQHRSRLHPLSDLPIKDDLLSGILGDKGDPQILYNLFDTESSNWYAPLVEQDDPPEGGGAADYIAWMQDKLKKAGRNQKPISGDKSELGDQKPMLYQMLKLSVNSASRIHQKHHETALRVLKQQSADSLERLLRETLGLASHRLDAWATSVAVKQLKDIREKRTNGIQLGGFGWVENLRPSEAPVSQGFIHTPSLNHAATAAILRSGWSAHGSDKDDSPLAVNLSSARVRLANWLLDGVRQGQALGDLLGYRFERYLHDHNPPLDAWIAPFRRAVLDASGEKNAAANSPVDGLELVELYDKKALEAVLKTGGGKRSALEKALEYLHECVDAVADAAVTESVYHLAQGNRLRANAMLDSISKGDIAPPELRAMLTPRSGVGISHRILVLLPESPSAYDWGGGYRKSLNSRMEAWVANLLGDPQRISCFVTVQGNDTLETYEVNMADLAISALDAVYAVSQGDNPGASELALRVQHAVAGMATPALLAQGSVNIDFAQTTQGNMSFEEFLFLARAIRQVLGAARSMDARDLMLPESGEENGLVLAQTETKTAALFDSLRDAHDKLTAVIYQTDGATPIAPAELDVAMVKARMLQLSRFGFGAAIAPPNVSAEKLQNMARSLSERTGGKLVRLDQNEADWQAAPQSDEKRFSMLTGQIQMIFGSDFPVPCFFKAVNSEDIKATLALSDQRLRGDKTAPFGWLQRVAKVRKDAAAFDETISLTEAVADTNLFSASVGQFPHHEKESWVALHRPAAGTGGRVSLAIFHQQAVAWTRQQCGLVIDEWVEQIPNAKETTGVSFHFDSPGSKPPQVMLLAMPPEKGKWSFDYLVNTVRESFEWARLRAVEPSTLQVLGHHLPAIYSSGVLEPGAASEDDEDI